MSATKIFAINSSPSGEKGTTARLLQAFLKGASEAGAETRVEYIFEQDIKPCVGCISCWIKTPGECAQKDDMKKMLEKIKDSDIIVYSTPLYIHNVNGPMKNFLDRRLPLINPFLEIRDGYTRHLHSEYVNYSKVVLVSSCGFPGLHNFDSVVSLFKIMCGFRGQEFSGALLRPGAGFMSDSDYEMVFSAARETGAQLVREGLISSMLLDKVSRQVISDEDYIESFNIYITKMRSRL